MPRHLTLQDEPPLNRARTVRNYADAVRGVAVVLSVLLLAAPAAGGGAKDHAKVAVLVGSRLVVVDLATHARRVLLAHAPTGPVHWSGGGRLISDAGRIVSGPSLATAEVAWAKTGEIAAYQTKNGDVILWTPHRSRTIIPGSWGAISLAWGSRGQLAIGRSICHTPCGVPLHQEVWIWASGKLRRAAGPLGGVDRPIVAGVTADGHALWWGDLEGSGSIAADGLLLHSDRAAIGTTLVYPDFVVRCGTHLALAAGGDRYATHGKRIVFDGRDVSRDATRSWVSPSCSAVPSRRQLTRPPAGWTDENPHLLKDGSIVFVRTRQTSFRRNGAWWSTTRAQIELLARGGGLVKVAVTSVTVAGTSPITMNFYGHYNWPSLIAVWP